MTGLPAGIHPERVAACFRASASGGFAERLMKEPRFTSRLNDLLAGQYGLAHIQDDMGDTPDMLLAGLGSSDLERLARRAGIVFYAHVFVQEIRGPMLAVFSERFGAEALEDARAHHDLAGGRPATDDLEALEKSVREEGKACLAAWIAALPEQLSRRVKLKWPNDTAVPVTVDQDLVERGTAILRRLAANMGQ